MPYKNKSRSIMKSSSKKRVSKTRVSKKRVSKTRVSKTRVSKKRVSKKAKGRQLSKGRNNMRPGRSKNNNIDSSLMVLERQF